MINLSMQNIIKYWNEYNFNFNFKKKQLKI